MARRRLRLSSKARLARSRFEESKHRRDPGGRFVDKPGAGDDAPRRVPVQSPTTRKLDTLDDWRAWFGETTGLPRPSEQQWDAITSYVGNNHGDINAALRRGRMPTRGVVDDRDLAANVRDMDSMLASARLPEDVVVYRGLSKEGRAQVERAAESGREMRSLGYTSVTVDRGYASRWQGDDLDVMEVRLPAGARAIPAGGFSPFGASEGELIVARNSSWRVRRATDGRYIMDWVDG